MFSRPLIFLCTAFAVLLAPLRAQEAGDVIDPDVSYFNSFLKREDAKKLADKGDFEKAEQNLRTALQLLIALQNVHPDYNADLIKRKVEEVEALLSEVSPKATEIRAARANKGSALVGGGTSQQLPQRISDARRLAHQREMDRLYRQISDLKTRLTQAEADRSRDRAKLRTTLQQLEDERSRRARQPLLDEVARLKSALQIASDERDALALAFKQTRKEKITLQAENTRLIAERDDLRTRNEDLTAKIAEQRGVNNSVVRSLRQQKKSLVKQLNATEEQLALSQGKVASLSERISQAEATIEELTSERDTLLAERDEMQELLKLGQSERTQEFIKQNILLGERVRKQQQLLDQLAASDDATKDELIEVRSQLKQAKTRLIAVSQRNAEQKRKIEAYELRLRDAEAQLAEAASSGNADPRDLRILRDALFAQQRQQVVRKKAAKVLIEAAKKQGVFEELGPAIQDVLGTDMELSEEQRTLIATAGLNEQDGITLDAGSNVTPTAIREAAERRLAEKIEAFTTAGRDAYVAGRYEIAAELFEIALDRHPGHVESHINRGVTALRLADLERAEESFRTAITMRETSYYAHQMLGSVLYQTGQRDEAEQSFQKTLELNPDASRALVFLGSLAAESGDLKSAEQHYTTALDIDSDLPTPLYNMARIFAARGEKDKARRYYERALANGASPDQALEAQILN